MVAGLPRPLMKPIVPRFFDKHAVRPRAIAVSSQGQRPLFVISEGNLRGTRINKTTPGGESLYTQVLPCGMAYVFARQAVLPLGLDLPGMRQSM